MYVIIIVIFVVAYLFGSIPFGFLAGRIFGRDITREGSGNIGATNAFRTFGPMPGIIVFLLDFLKGTTTIILTQKLISDPMIIAAAGIAVILGHIYSIFIGFKGGRGVATGLGVLVGLNIEVFTLSVTWALIIVLLSQYVSLASISGAVIAPVLMLAYRLPLPYSMLVLLASILIIYRHIPNIKRLIAGTERKILADAENEA